MSGSTGRVTGGDYLEQPMSEFVEHVAGPEPVPAAGSVVAANAVLAAALAAKVARRSATRLLDAEEVAARADQLRRSLEPVITDDAVAYAGVLATPRESPERAEAIWTASNGPAVIADAMAEVAEIAARLCANGNPNLRYDAAAAARLAATSAAVAASLVSANTQGTGPAQAAREAADRAANAADAITGDRSS